MSVHKLPPSITPFVGRTKELSQIATLLADANCRLLTLVGIGGIGKTRLARQVALVNAYHYPDGVYFISLQAIKSPEHIIPAIVESIPIQFSGSVEPKQQLLGYLENKRILLVLDNLEHILLGDLELLSEIMNAAPKTVLLTTSRERLNLLEEWVFEVIGLSVPSYETELIVKDYDAIQLFVQTARRIRPHFSLEDEQTYVVRICTLLGGMPLAIELAVSWLRMLSGREIAAEIVKGLDILETASRSMPPRHRNIRVMLDQSWSLLSDDERAVFKALCVFQGGFTRGGAEAVAGASLHLLSKLIDKSWLQYNSISERYDIHPLLHQYGYEQLNVLADHCEFIHSLYCGYYADFMHQKWGQITSNEPNQAFREIEAELDNVRAAWAWGLQRKQSVYIEKFFEGLWFFYDQHYWFHEGETIFAKAARAFSMEGDSEPLCAKILMYHGFFYGTLRRFEQAENLLRQSIAIFRRHGLRQELAFALDTLSGLFREVKVGQEHHLTEKRIYLEESYAIYKEIGDKWGLARALSGLSLEATFQSRHEESIRLSQESNNIYRNLDNDLGISATLTIEGINHYYLANYQQAKVCFQESLTIGGKVGNYFQTMYTLAFLGSTLLALNEASAALPHIYQSLKMAVDVELHFSLFAHETLIALAELLAKHARKVQALEILTAALREYPQVFPLSTRPRALQLLSKLRTEVPKDLATEAIERGSSQLLKTLISALLQDWNHFEELAHLPTNIVQSLPELLTPREMEILRLLAKGLSNPEIAEQLVVTVGTVKSHTHRIFGKLGIGSRTQAILRAKELKLV